jgi:Family of unknown function (DUF5906)
MEILNDIPYTSRPDGLQFILDHILMLCDYDDVMYQYFIRWIAFMFQKPEIKITCVILISKPGAGKTSLILLLKKLMGGKKVFECSDPARDVWGSFNSLMMDAFLVNLSELEYADSKDSLGKIKALITDEDITINQKGISPITVRSYHHFIGTTNKENPIKIEKGERRFFIVRSSDDKIGNRPHFDKMYSLMEDIDVLRSCYDYFKTLDLTGYNPQDIPLSEHKESLKELSVSPIEDWLREYTFENKLNTEIITLSGSSIHQLFKDWSVVENRKYDITSTNLAIKLTNLRIKGVGKGLRDEKGLRTKTFNFVELKEYFNIE